MQTRLKRGIYVALTVILLCTLIAASLFCLPANVSAAEVPSPDEYIFFDLSAGSVTINGSTYTGYRYDGNSTPRKITGTFDGSRNYYVYQSDGNINTGVFDNGDGTQKVNLPTHKRVTGWADYSVNNPDVETVIGEWQKRAQEAGRKYTSNNITVTGQVNCNMVIDNICSSFHEKGTSRVSGGLSFHPNTTNSNLTIQTKGDNRFGNIFYTNTKSSTTFTIAEKEPGSTLTVANINKGEGKNYWCSGIGGCDGTYESTYGLRITGGTIYVGTTAKDDCTAIGGGGNGHGEVTITGGTITASVESSGAAIGGGIGKTSHGGSANVTIGGNSKVYAYNSSCTSRINPGTTIDSWYSNASPRVKYIPAAAIGGGSSARSVCNPCTIVIKDNAEVFAQTVGGAAIGGGSSADVNGGNATVNILGNARVTAISKSGTIEGELVPAGNAIGGGVGGRTGNGGSVTLNISEQATLKVGSVGGGNTIGNKSTYKIGSAAVTVSGGSISGQFIMAAGSNTNCSFTMTAGIIDNTGRHTNEFLETSGGAVYMDDPSGKVNISGGTIKNCTAINGGAVYMTAGEFSLSQNGIISNCSATNNGGAVYIGGGNVYIHGGSIRENVAQNCGGGIAITNGNYYMYGGEVSQNTAVASYGGGIYISSNQDNAEILIRSGRITNNSAGNSGGAMGVHGQDGVSFTINIGANIAHTFGINSHECDGKTENCPIIESNTAIKSGGGIYLAGSYDAKMNMYCIVENKANKNMVGSGDNLGVSPSNFMMVEGGSLLISTKSGDQHGQGNVVINSSVHVTGGQVTLMGKGNNPMFTESITVNVDETNDSFFKDLREKDSSSTIYTVQYFENFEENGKISGQYIAIDVDSSEKHTVRAALYNHTGHTIQGWDLMVADSEGNHVPADPPTMYTGGISIDVKKDIILYARWTVSGYTIVFEAGVNSYQGEMSPQEFDYTEKKALNANSFVNIGYVFDCWIDKSTINKPSNEQIKYTDKQEVSGLSIVHGAQITLVAQWKICYHNDMSDYTHSKTDTSISRQCSCLGYTETATLVGGTFTYTGDAYPANINYDRITLNGERPSEIWDLLISYTGKNWSNVEFSNVTVPVNAGQYTATVTFDELTVSVTLTINKGEQDPPRAPEYTVTKSSDGTKNIIKISQPSDDKSNLLEYQFSWYGLSKLEQSDWIPWDPIDIPFKDLSIAYTNYYVDVRYAETDNYLASIAIRGEYIIYYTGTVIFHITADDKTLIPDVVWGSDAQQSGITVTLTPQKGYYIYNIETDPENTDFIQTDVPEYPLPDFDHQEKSGDKWVIWINNIQDYSTTVNITIHFEGAAKKITVDSAVAKDQQFKDITQEPQADVTISRDSAYTFAFSVKNYLHYKDPFIDFGDAPLPVGMTVIMKDLSDSSYWSYKVKSSVSKIYLNEFTRMGTAAAPECFELGDRTSFSLQFIADFSRCENAGSFDTLNTLNVSFKATAQSPDGANSVPQIPDNSMIEIDLADKPSFSISQGASTNELTQVVVFQFAQNSNEAAGISKWSNTSGLLIVAPTGNTILPADAKLQVRIGNSTSIYGLTGDKFIVTLPSFGSGTAYLTLLSDMFSNESRYFDFTVSLGFAETQVKNAPSKTDLTTDTLDLRFSIFETIIPSVHAELISDNPEYKNGTISSVEFSVTVRNTSNYSVRAVLYNKNADGEYSSTTQTMYLEIVNDTYVGTLDLSSLKDEMSQKIGSLSLMLNIEVVDGNGKTVNSVPLYFILVDSRQ